MTDGYQTRLYYTTTETSYVGMSGTWSELEGIDTVTPPSIEAADVETSHMMTPDRTKTYKAGWIEPGTLQATMYHTPEIYTAMHGLLSKPKGFLLLLENGIAGGANFNGYLKSIGEPVEREGNNMIDVTIKVSGLPVALAANQTPPVTA